MTDLGDEFDAYLAEKLTDPEFAGAYEAARARVPVFSEEQAASIRPAEEIPFVRSASALTKFLRARIAEDEDFARAAGDFQGPRLLAECEARRRIVGYITEARVRHMDHPEDPYILRTLGVVYSDHEDYRAEWLP